jgi:hypothetical protein
VTGPQSLTVASIVSRRAGRCSDLAHGTGDRHIRTQCPRSGAARAGWRPPDPHPYLLARDFRIVAANRAFKPAGRTVAPAGPAGMRAQRACMRPVFPSVFPSTPSTPSTPSAAWAGPPPVHGCDNVNTRVCTLPQPYKLGRGARGQCDCWCERGQPGRGRRRPSVRAWAPPRSSAGARPVVSHLACRTGIHRIDREARTNDNSFLWGVRGWNALWCGRFAQEELAGRGAGEAVEQQAGDAVDDFRRREAGTGAGSLRAILLGLRVFWV